MIKKILILRLSSIGDIVLTQPVAQVLRETYPKASIEYLTKEPYIGLVKSFGCVDKIHVWNNKKTILRKLRGQKFDVVIDLHSKLNTFFIKLSVCGRKTVTYSKKHFLRWKIIKKLTNKSILSTVDVYFTALSKLGIKEKIKYPRLYPDPELKNIVNFHENYSSKKLIGIFPGALHKTKMYPLDKLAEFINIIPEDWKCKFLILGSGSEKDLAEELATKFKLDLTNLCGEFDIPNLIGVIDQFDGMISNDSGPMHIAAALGIPQIAIFGATHPKLGFAPLNKRSVVLSSNISCQPCSLHGGDRCPKKHFLCMKSISPELIKDSLARILNSNSI